MDEYSGGRSLDSPLFISFIDGGHIPLSTTINDDITYRHCGLQLGEMEIGYSRGQNTVFFYHRTVHFKPFYYEPANNKMLTINVSKS